MERYNDSSNFEIKPTEEAVSEFFAGAFTPKQETPANAENTPTVSRASYAKDKRFARTIGTLAGIALSTTVIFGLSSAKKATSSAYEKIMDHFRDTPAEAANCTVTVRPGDTLNAIVQEGRDAGINVDIQRTSYDIVELEENSFIKDRQGTIMPGDRIDPTKKLADLCDGSN